MVFLGWGLLLLLAVAAVIVSRMGLNTWWHLLFLPPSLLMPLLLYPQLSGRNQFFWLLGFLCVVMYLGFFWKEAETVREK